MAERLDSELLTQYVKQVREEMVRALEAERGMNDTELKISGRDRVALSVVIEVVTSAPHLRTSDLESEIASYHQRSEDLLNTYQTTRAALEALQVAAGQATPIVLPSGRPLRLGVQETPKLKSPVADHQNERVSEADQLKQSEQA